MRHFHHCAIASVFVAAMPIAAGAQTISGKAVVIDGDSLEVDGARVRLFGIDAPEADQTCDRAGQVWRCGEDAKRQLSALIGEERVDCQGQGKDQYDRTLAVCAVGYTQLNAVMVETGAAVAFRQYSDAYIVQEARAKADRAGVWGSNFMQPDEFRAGKRDPNTRPQNHGSAGSRRAPVLYAADGLCTIKGNRNRKGQWIYHMPGMPYYEATNPEELFCSEAAAQAAGYRRAIVRP